MSDDDFRAGLERILREACGDEAVILPSTERLRELKARASRDDLTDAERDAAVAEWLAEIKRVDAEERRRRTN